MNLQRLEVFDAVVQNDFNVSRAAEALRQSQPGLSRQLALLEQEIGAPLFFRSGKRFVGLTGLGEEVHRVATRMLKDAETLAKVKVGYRNSDRGSLVLATTHTQARYAIPKVVRAFRERYPKVRLTIHQGSPTQVCEEVVEGRADMAIATESLGDYDDLVVLPCYEWNRSIIAPIGHPILDVPCLSLREVARYPIITYASAFSGRSQVNAAFVAQGLTPDVVISAIDADVIKTYVSLGLGLGIVASMAIDRSTDTNLGVLDASSLFPNSMTGVALRRGALLKGYMYAFIELVAPHLTVAEVDRALLSTGAPDTY